MSNAAQKEDSQSVTMMVPVDLLRRVDAQVEATRKKSPMTHVTRSDIMRILLDRGLTATERAR